MLAKLGRNKIGVAAVEFALLLPVLLLLLVGVIEFGRLMWVNSSLQFAAEEGARYALAHNTAATSDITGVVQARLDGIVDTNTVQMAVTNSASLVNVTLTYTFTFVADGILPYGPLTLKAVSNIPRS